MATVRRIDNEIAELYWRTQFPEFGAPIEYGETGWFGSKLVKSIGKVASSVAKVAVSPVTHAVKAASDIAHGKNVVKSLGNYVKADLATAKTVAPYVQAVASFVPGVGTMIAMGIGGARAAIDGKSLTDIGKGLVSGAIPGGPIVAAVAMTAANAAVAGVQGKNIAKAAANELMSHAAGMIPSGELQGILKSAVTDALAGKNVLKSMKAAAIRQAIAAIPDATAREAASAAVAGRPPAEIIAKAGAKLLGQAAAKNLPAVSSLLQSVQTAAKSIPKEVKAAMGPTLSPSVRSLKPVVRFASAPARTLENTMRSVRSNAFNQVVAHRPLTQKGRGFILSRAGRLARDVSGLTTDGKWLVQTGDTGEKIALALTGSKARWTELKAVNPSLMKARAADAAKYGFPIYKGDVINLPASWTAVAPTPAPAAQPVIVPASAPMGQPIQDVIISQLPTILAPSGDLAAQLQTRVLLATWGKTDGANQAGLSDYGGQVELSSTGWTSRDKLEAAAFQNWWNRSYRPSAPFLNVTGDWNQGLNDALHDWAEKKAAGATAPSVSVPAVTVTPAATSTIPASGGTPPITLPGITIAATPPATSAPTAQASKTAAPTGFAAWWTNNKGAAIPGIVGLAVSVGSKYV